MHNKLNLIMRGGRVKRYHVMDTLKQQTVAEHSFGVAWLVYQLSEGMPSVDLLMASLAHDVAECETGDLPAPAKKKLGISEQFAKYEDDILDGAGVEPFYVRLSDAERKILKFADTSELMLYCIREMSLGNMAMQEVYERGASYLHEMMPWTPEMMRVVHYINVQHSTINNRKGT